MDKCLRERVACMKCITWKICSIFQRSHFRLTLHRTSRKRSIRQLDSLEKHLWENTCDSVYKTNFITFVSCQQHFKLYVCKFFWLNHSHCEASWLFPPTVCALSHQNSVGLKLICHYKVMLQWKTHVSVDCSKKDDLDIV
jgi:hypothetical protein